MKINSKHILLFFLLMSLNTQTVFHDDPFHLDLYASPFSNNLEEFNPFNDSFEASQTDLFQYSNHEETYDSPLFSPDSNFTSISSDDTETNSSMIQVTEKKLPKNKPPLPSGKKTVNRVDKRYRPRMSELHPDKAAHVREQNRKAAVKNRKKEAEKRQNRANAIENLQKEKLKLETERTKLLSSFQKLIAEVKEKTKLTETLKIS